MAASCLRRRATRYPPVQEGAMAARLDLDRPWLTRDGVDASADLDLRGPSGGYDRAIAGASARGSSARLGTTRGKRAWKPSRTPVAKNTAPETR